MKRRPLLFFLVSIFIISILTPIAFATNPNLSNNQTVYSTEKLLNHAVKLIAVELRKDCDGSPYLDFTVDKAHEDIQLLNNISNQRVYTNVWLKVDDGEWGDAGTYLFINEEFTIDARNFLENIDNYEGAVYEAKIRYSFDNKYYPAEGKTGNVFSPFSNVIFHGISVYEGANSCTIEN